MDSQSKLNLYQECAKVFYDLSTNSDLDYITYDLARFLQLQSLDKYFISKKRIRVPLSLEKKFYTYVLLDPRKPGIYKYRLPCGKIIKFDYEPFYVGKGKGKRVYFHKKRAFKSKKNNPCLDKIRKIYKEGYEVIYKRVGNLTIDSVSLAKEIILIQSIGRKDKLLGPLLNLTAGGEGSGNWIMTKKQRQENSNRLTGKKHKIVTCPYCNKSGGFNSMSRYHFDNCKKNPINDGQKIKQNIVTCPYCNKSGGKSNLTRYHFDNCLHKPGNENLIRPKEIEYPKVECPWCGFIGGGTSMKRWHFDNCPDKPGNEKIDRTYNKVVCQYCGILISNTNIKKHENICKLNFI